MKQKILIQVEITFGGELCHRFCAGLEHDNFDLKSQCRFFKYENIKYDKGIYFRCQQCINATNNSTLPGVEA